MNFAGLIYLLAAHYFTGKGCLRLFNLQLKPVENSCLSLITGVPLLSFAPCFLQLLHIPITAVSVSAAIAFFTLAFSIPLIINFKRPTFPKIVFPELYEWPFLIVCLALILLSIWRCFYYPVFARDMLTGPELLAEYTVREKTMINSVFTIDLGITKIDMGHGPEVSLSASNNNNLFKSPYITSLQIIYKLLVQPFGQLWMTVLFLPLMLWFYSLLTGRIHRFFASFILFLFLISPDLYAYSYVMLYDYSNMIFFFTGFYFLMKYLDNDKINFLAWSAFSFGIATYIRGETVILTMMMLPLLLGHYYKKRIAFRSVLLPLAIFILAPLAFNFLSVDVFLSHFIPMRYSMGSLLNPNLLDISLFFSRLQEINDKLVFGKIGEGSYAYYIQFFVGLLAIDIICRIIWRRRFNREALLLLYGIAVVYLGMAFLGYLIPATTLENTTKRGIFKAMPMVMLYMANSGFLLFLSGKLSEVKVPKTAKAPIPAKAQVRQAPRAVQKPPVKKR